MDSSSLPLRQSKWWLPSKLFVLSASVGVTATALDWITLVVTAHFGLNERYAVLPAFVAGTSVQFVGNRFLVFRNRPQDSAAVLRSARRFFIVEGIALVLNALVYNVLREVVHIDFRISRLLAGGVVYVGFSYPLWRRVFAPTGR